MLLGPVPWCRPLLLDWGPSGDSFDDNPDDSCCSERTHYTPVFAESCLFRGCARSWQCGGQGG